MDYEHTAELAQKYLEDRPVVVLGCGASIPYGLPSMSELSEALIGKIELSDKTWIKFRTDLSKTQDLEISLNNVDLSAPILERVVEETWKITTEKDIAVHDRLLQGTTKLALTRLFQFLLRTANPQVSVVTTNYDRLAEYAANSAKADVYTGFTSGWLQRFVSEAPRVANLHKNPGFEGVVHIWKVHGSLDWFQSPASEPIAIPLAREIPSNFQPLIVTPGTSKYREVYKDPFRTVMTQSDATLRTAQSYLCIGYGFNDEHVQSILHTRVRNDNLPIVIVTKKLTDAAKRLFVTIPASKFLIVEEGEGGTMVYCPENPNGQLLENYDLWKLDCFLNMLLGE